jgi:hypothetical protein
VKSIMDWVKANLAIVILSVVILLVLPAAFFGSHYWNNRIKTKREADANKAMSDLKSLAISYTLPLPIPGTTPVTSSLEVPNAAATTFYRENRKQVEDQVAQVADVAKAINQADHKLLVDGLFVMPPAAPEAATGGTGAPAATGAPGASGGTGTPGATSVDPLKTLELEEILVGKADKPSVYQQLLDGIHAGGPADPIKMAEVVRDLDLQAHEAVKAQSNRTQLTPEEQKDLTTKLVAARIGECERQGSKVSIYATIDVLQGIPRTMPAETPDPLTCYEWQYDYWLFSDLLKAIDSANAPGGQHKGVSQSVVKRIESITLDPATAPAPPSVTGRKPTGDTKLFDVRGATLNVVASSSRLPELIDAISRTNFMTVVGVDLAQVNPWSDLDLGYYYGSENVVRATIRVESVWLRSWTEPLMPQAFRDALNPAANPDAAAAAAAAPTTPRASKAAAAVEESPRGVKGRNTPPPRSAKGARRGKGDE